MKKSMYVFGVVLLIFGVLLSMFYGVYELIIFNKFLGIPLSFILTGIIIAGIFIDKNK